MNKRIIYVLLGVSMSAFLSPLYAQQEEDYLPDGKTWSMRSVAGPERWTYTVSVFGEVEKCGHIWKRSRTDELEFLLHRQEGKKIWALCPYDNGWMDTVPFLMFDFGLKKGDTAHLYVDTTWHRDDAWIVESVFDSVFEPGQEARHCQRVYLMSRPEIKDIWVEGVGSLTNGLTYSPAGFLRGPSELICVQKATGDIVYHNKKYSSCYIDDAGNIETYTGTLISMPNPATEIPTMPGMVMGLRCDGKQYVLSKIGWFWDGDYVKEGGVRCEEGDSVEIKGVLSTHIDLLNNTYFELEIDTINKINTLLQQDDYLSEGKEWVMRNSVSGMFFDGGYVNFRSVLILDEVEKYGHIWKRSLSDGIEYWLYRQEGKKIWVTYPNDDDERDTSPLLIFDFGLKKGDTAHLYGSMNETWIVEDVFDSVFEKEIGIKHCLYVYLMGDPERKDLWVEGVGSLTRGIDYAPANYVGGWSELICVQNSAREVLYHNARYTECNYPNHFSYDYSIQNWSVLCTGGGETPRHTELMRFKEEGRKQWNQAYRATQEDFSDEKPLGWYYQDMLQVYFKEKEADTAILLYDFGLEKGERFLNENHEIWVVDSVYYEKIDGLERRCQRMVSETGEVDIWVEGIGSLKTGFFPADFFDEHSATELLCVQADVFWHRNYMYHNARYNTCYIVEETSTEKTDESCAMVRYDAAHQTLVIESDVRIDGLEVFDAQGRCVMKANNPAGSVSVARLPRGLYLYRLTAAGTTLSGKFVR